MRMKRNLLIVLIIVLTTNVSSQLKNGDVAIALNGNYNRTGNYTGVSNNSLSSINSTFSTGVSVSVIENHFLLGLGIDYISQNETKLSVLNFQNDLVQLEQELVRYSAKLPNIQVGYYWSLIKNLYFNANLKVGVGVFSSQTISITDTQGLPNNNPSLVMQQVVEQGLYTNAGLHPEFTYFFGKRFGVSLYPGGIDYSFVNWNTANSNLIFNINPGNWFLGVKYVF